MQIMTSLFHFPLLSDWLAADILWYKSGLDRDSCVAFGSATEEAISEERASDISSESASNMPAYMDISPQDNPHYAR